MSGLCKHVADGDSGVPGGVSYAGVGLQDLLECLAADESRVC